jgi:hypothetical protein
MPLMATKPQNVISIFLSHSGQDSNATQHETRPVLRERGDREEARHQSKGRASKQSVQCDSNTEE